MKNFILLTGPQAVGKMAVGMALRDKYNYRLFHNHMSIEMVIDIYGDLHWDLVGKMRDMVFDKTLSLDLEGFVFTFVWAYNLESDYQFVDNLVKRFEAQGWKATIVELVASLDTRLERNKTDLRLEHKATKRNLDWSENELKTSMDKYRLTSFEGEVTHPSYIRINNEGLQPEEVADRIYAYIKGC